MNLYKLQRGKENVSSPHTVFLDFVTSITDASLEPITDKFLDEHNTLK